MKESSSSSNAIATLTANQVATTTNSTSICKRLYICNRRNNLIRVDDKFYTEDGILVFVLYVNNVPLKVNSDALKKYFISFGPVESVIYKKKRKTTVGEERFSAIVRFEKPNHASKALRKKTHTLEGIRLIVRAADSWIQPHKIRMEPIKKVDDSDISSFILLKLNDYCLFNIFNLIDYCDQVRVTMVSERIKKIFIAYYRSRKELKLNHVELDGLSLMDIKDSFILIGKYIERLSINCSQIDRFYRVYDFILKFFPNLKDLYMEDVDMQFKESNKEISGSFKKLTSLTLLNCHVYDKHVKKLNRLRQLNTLNLSFNVKMEGKFLHNFPKLTSMYLKNCIKVDANNIKRIFESLPNLKLLDAFGIAAFDTLALWSTMIEKAKNLEELHLTSYKLNNDDLAIVPRLQNIKRIRLSFAQINQHDTGLKAFLNSCVENKIETMEYLGIIGKELHLTKENISAICGLKNLKELEINRLRDADCMFWSNLSLLLELEELKFEYAPSEFDEMAFISWLKKAKKIKKISAGFTDFKVKLDFIHQLIDVLNEISKERNSKIDKKEKIQIIVRGVLHENNVILSDQKYLENSSLIKVELKESAEMESLGSNLVPPDPSLNNLQERLLAMHQQQAEVQDALRNLHNQIQFVRENVEGNNPVELDVEEEDFDVDDNDIEDLYEEDVEDFEFGDG